MNEDIRHLKYILTKKGLCPSEIDHRISELKKFMDGRKKRIQLVQKKGVELNGTNLKRDAGKNN